MSDGSVVGDCCGACCGICCKLHLKIPLFSLKNALSLVFFDSSQPELETMFRRFLVTDDSPLMSSVFFNQRRADERISRPISNVQRPLSLTGCRPDLLRIRSGRTEFQYVRNPRTGPIADVFHHCCCRETRGELRIRSTRLL